MATLEARVWDWLCASPRRAALLLGLCAFSFAVPGIGNLDGLGHSDEHFYLSIAADTYDTGHIAPTHDGAYIFQKPPLVFWIARLCMAVLGRSGAAARLPGAIAAGLLVAAGTLFTAEIAGAALAPLAGAYLLGSLALARFDRELMLDLPLSACLGFALWAAARAVRDPGRLQSGATVWAGLLAGLCLAIKGPIGVGVLGVATLLALARERRWDLLRSARCWMGVGLGLCISAPWYVWALATHPQQFYAFHIEEQYLSRFETAHGQSRFNLLWGTLLYAAPYWPFALLAAFRPRRGVRWAWVAGWLLAFYGIFLLPKEHGLHYPLLVLIPLATLAASAMPPCWTRLVVSLALVCGAAVFGATTAFPEIPSVPAIVASASRPLGAPLSASASAHPPSSPSGDCSRGQPPIWRSPPSDRCSPGHCSPPRRPSSDATSRSRSSGSTPGPIGCRLDGAAMPGKCGGNGRLAMRWIEASSSSRLTMQFALRRPRWWRGSSRSSSGGERGPIWDWPTSGTPGGIDISMLWESAAPCIGRRPQRIEGRPEAALRRLASCARIVVLPACFKFGA